MINELFIPVDKQSTIKLHVQVYEHIKDQIQQGQLQPLTKLPSVRQLANITGVSRNTVEHAYEWLASEGFIKSRQRSGYFVEEMESAFHQKVQSSANAKREDEQEGSSTYDYDFRINQIDAAYFPMSVWRKMMNRSVTEDYEGIYTYGDPQGERGLRKEIALYLHQGRGLDCSPEQIVIGSNTQYLVNLLCQITGLGGQVAFEEPGYYAARSVFELFRYDVQSIPVTDNGIDELVLWSTNANMLYITPSHQIPTGKIMSFEQRKSLIKWAVTNNSYIIEDDLMNEFQYEGPPLPSLFQLDEQEHVVYLGSFFKTLLPSVRLNYMVLPKHLLQRYQSDFVIYQQTTTKILQKTLEQFMSEGHWIRHIRRMRTIYKKKFYFTHHMIRKYFENRVQVTGDEAGLHIVVELEHELSQDSLVQKAKQLGVGLDTLDLFYKNPLIMGERKRFLLSFANLSEEEIEEGVRRLSVAWSD